MTAKKNFIKSAIRKPKKAGASGATGKRARLALALAKMRRK